MPCTLVRASYKLSHLVINYPYRTGIVLTSILLRGIDTEWSSSNPKAKCSEALVPHPAPLPQALHPQQFLLRAHSSPLSGERPSAHRSQLSQ